MTLARALRRQLVLVHTGLAAIASVGPAGRAKMSTASGHKLVAQGTSLILEPNGGPVTSSVIFMHGLGDTAHGWVDSVDEFFAPALPGTRFTLLTAPTRPVTVNGGMPMPAWYDIASLGKDRLGQQSEGLEASRARVAGVVASEVARGVPASKVVLAGFSQGGAMSLYTGLNLEHTLGGILCMSGYLVYPPGVQPGPAAKATPVLMLHGEDDPLVLPSYSRDSAAKLRELGVADVKLKMYPDLPHSASPEELADALAFLKARLA